MSDAKDAGKLGRVTACFNHKDRPGTVRCSSCLRPVCEECVIVDSADRRYCSQKCLDGAIALSERVADLNSRPPPSRTLPVVSSLLLLAALGGAWYAWKHWKAILGLYHHYFG